MDLHLQGLDDRTLAAGAGAGAGAAP